MNLPPYVYRSRRKNGKWRYRFERRGYPKVTINGRPGTEEFMDQYRAILAGNPIQPKPSHRPGSFAELFEKYAGPLGKPDDDKASAEWQALHWRTQKQRRHFYRQIAEEFPEGLADALTPAMVAKLRDERSATPGAANNLLKALSAFYRWAVHPTRRLVSSNPAIGVERLRLPGPGFKPWTRENLGEFVEHWPLGTKPYLALSLLLFTSCRRGDLVKLGRHMISNGFLEWTQEKGKDTKPREVFVPILPPLQEALDTDICGDFIFLLTEYGKPFTNNGFGAWWADKCDKAGISARAHGIRKAAGGLLADMGCTEYEIMAVQGHADPSSSAIYTKTAQRRELAKSAMAKMAGFKW